MVFKRSAAIKLKNAELETKRQERRLVLEPAVLGVVSALGGYEDVLVENKNEDHDQDQEEDDDDEIEIEGQEKKPTPGSFRTERVYKLGDECLGCLKDLKKFWRLDEEDENRTVARILYSSQIVPNDLLPILLSTQIENKKDHRVALLCADLIAALTWPVDVAKELKEACDIEDEEERRQATNIDFSSLVDGQLSYKRDIVRTGAMGPIFRLIVPVIQKPKNERTEKDENVISLVLHIIRNLLALRDKPASGPGIEESHLQSDFIQQLSKFGIFDLLIHMSHGSNRFDEFGQWNMIVLNIWDHLFRGVDAEDLIDAETCVGTNDTGETISTVKASDKKLESLLLDEEQARKAKARKSTTRHSRFGTTLSVTTGQRKFNLHSQTAITTPVELALDARKNQKKKPNRVADEFGRPTVLKSDAMKILRGVAIEFIESGFNPFFLSILKDIQREKAKATDAIRLLYLLGFFLDCFLKLREREKSVGILPTSETGHDFDLVADLMEPECMLWVFGKIQSGLEDKPMPIVEIHAAVECLIQQLLVIEGLTTSGVEDYTQVANVMLNRLYYDADTLDMVIKLMSKYTNQSLKYLENIVHFSFVFLKILERYAGSTDYMYVRKKKKARKSKQKQTGLESADQVDGGADEGETRNPVEDEEEAFLEAERSGVEFAEHKFEFGKFQQRFAHEAVASTLITYLRGYREFTDPELMKRVVKLMYRQAVGASAPQLFYRVSVLDTFNTMIEEKSSMPKHPVYTDLFRFIDYILKQYFKSVGESPFIIIEALCNHGMRDWNRTFDSSSEDSDGMPSKASTSRKVPKLPVEIEVRPGLSWSQRLGVAVGLLVDKSKSDLVNKVQDILRTASASRTAIVLMNDEPDDDDPQVDLESWLQYSGKDPSEELRAQLKQPSDTSMGKFEDHRAEAGEDNEFKTALARDAELHMLLRLLSWESEEEYPGHLGWTIPKGRTHSELDLDIKVIDHFLINPLDHDGKSPAELTKKKRKRRAKLPELTPAELALDDSTDSDKQQAAKKAPRKSKKPPKITGQRSTTFVTLTDNESDEEPDRLQSLNRSNELNASEVNGLKRNAGMIDGQGEGENEDDGISGVQRKPIKSRKLFIDDSDEDS
ncbi:Topoisomerase 1-associated factor 1 [Puccinia graminis f. sp. tritici]|uniref:Topoisomerase 1-associated factor 1 n=1 Tax=Puccinia graminis f. sp. tritici TaxID=56615 RepID=A0A5B0SA72_PUCGR|nr:Topoisomerase 1-associated factor 1 [Puccinia graminis f. sp. tritici]KAA1134355.1 Topoisomerase 1-associated factor 1 [Puccinia graminis f. sp. tritici]